MFLNIMDSVARIKRNVVQSSASEAIVKACHAANYPWL